MLVKRDGVWPKRLEHSQYVFFIGLPHFFTHFRNSSKFISQYNIFQPVSVIAWAIYAWPKNHTHNQNVKDEFNATLDTGEIRIDNQKSEAQVRFFYFSLFITVMMVIILNSEHKNKLETANQTANQNDSKFSSTTFASMLTNLTLKRILHTHSI